MLKNVNMLTIRTVSTVNLTEGTPSPRAAKVEFFLALLEVRLPLLP